MNLLFLSLLDFQSIRERGIYTDLLREFAVRGHNVYIISPFERRNVNLAGIIKEDENVSILKVKIGNTQKTNIIEKGISTIFLEYQIKNAVLKYWGDVRFDIILYATPPVTFEKIISSVIKNVQDKFFVKPVTYLMLKDIFPQNAVDLGMFGKDSPVYRYFRIKEKRLYKISDYIGCMSPENCRYLLRHNPEINKDRVEVLPNALSVEEKNSGSRETDAGAMVKMALKKSRRKNLEEKYNIPEDAVIFLYGGNLGKPQDIGYIINCLKANEGKKDRFFLICGSGTEYQRLLNYYEAVKDRDACNFHLEPVLSGEEYDMLSLGCDAGLIFLDHRFTIPNFPSRLLSYMQAGIPVLAATDINTDIGKIITKNGFGFWCESSSVENFTQEAEKIIENKDKLGEMGNKGMEYLFRHFTAAGCVEKIMARWGKV